MEPGITWYDVLGAVPDAETRTIKRKYQDKVALAATRTGLGRPVERARGGHAGAAPPRHGVGSAQPSGPPQILRRGRRSSAAGRRPGPARHWDRIGGDGGS